MGVKEGLGKTVTVVGASFLVLCVSALALAFYAEALSKTKSAILMVCAMVSASVLAVGWYLQAHAAGRKKEDGAAGRARCGGEGARG